MTTHQDLVEEIDAAMASAKELISRATGDERRMLQLSRDRLFEAFQWAAEAAEEANAPTVESSV